MAAKPSEVEPVAREAVTSRPPRPARLPALLLGLVLAIAALLAGASLLLDDAGSAPRPHPEHPSLLVAGAVAAESPALLAVGWAFGVLQIAFFGACLALGLQRRGRLGPLARPLALGLVGYAGLWTALVAAYAASAGRPDAALWGAFPAPTAWLLYGLWPFPLFFAWLYVRHFDTWILNEDDLARFRDRSAELEAVRRREAAGPDA